MSKKISSIIIKAVPLALAFGISAGGFLFTQYHKKKEKTEKKKQDTSTSEYSASESSDSKNENVE